METLRRSAQLLTCLLIAIALAGCDAGADAVSAETQCSEIPGSFRESEQTWTRSETIAERDQADLIRFFQRHPSLAESSVTAGDPVLFTPDDSSRRFYWIRSTASGCQWLMIEMSRRSARYETGDGSPFPD